MTFSAEMFTPSRLAKCALVAVMLALGGLDCSHDQNPNTDAHAFGENRGRLLDLLNAFEFAIDENELVLPQEITNGTSVNITAAAFTNIVFAYKNARSDPSSGTNLTDTWGGQLCLRLTFRRFTQNSSGLEEPVLAVKVISFGKSKRNESGGDDVTVEKDVTVPSVRVLVTNTPSAHFDSRATMRPSH